jgi:CheY-like chemotaxis protein
VTKILLIVEDDEDHEFALADLLTDCGYRTVGARNGLEALEVLGRVQPFVIIVDLMMPLMDGYTLIDSLRSDSRFASIPILVVTAGRNVDRSRLDGLPIFTKPLDRDALVSAISACEMQAFSRAG